MPTMVPPASKHRVLVVEDERPLLSYLSALLNRDYEVFTAESTIQAEELLRANPVEVVLCDHDMPGEKGLDFLSRMRTVYPKTQRILLTGHAEADVFLRAINEGDVLKFLVKPSSLGEIRQAVELGLQEHGRMIETEQIEHEHHQLQQQVHSVPYVSRRLSSMAQGAWDLLGTAMAASMVGAGFVFILGIVVVLALYVFKTTMGIDLLENTKLGGLLPF